MPPFPFGLRDATCSVPSTIVLRSVRCERQFVPLFIHRMLRGKRLTASGTRFRTCNFFRLVKDNYIGLTLLCWCGEADAMPIARGVWRLVARVHQYILLARRYRNQWGSFQCSFLPADR